MTIEDMKKIKKDALWWTLVSVLWIFILILGINSKEKNIWMVAMIFIPIGVINAVKKWMVVRKGWEI